MQTRLGAYALLEQGGLEHGENVREESEGRISHCIVD